MARTSEDRPSHHLCIGGSPVICGLNYFSDGVLNHSIVFLFLIYKRKGIVLVILLLIFLKMRFNLQFLIWGDIVVCACELLPTPTPAARFLLSTGRLLLQRLSLSRESLKPHSSTTSSSLGCITATWVVIKTTASYVSPQTY